MTINGAAGDGARGRAAVCSGNFPSALAANNEHGALPYAMLDHAPETVCVLMAHGAHAR